MAGKKKGKTAKRQKLPFGVGCLAFFMLLGSLIGFTLVGLIVWFKKEALSWHWPNQAREFLKEINPVWLVVIGGLALLNLFTAIGLFRRKIWAYYLYTVMTGMEIGYEGYLIFRSHDYTSIVHLLWQIGIAWYLFLPRVRKVFA